MTLSRVCSGVLSAVLLLQGLQLSMQAHRLDECLQAVRLELTMDGARVEMDITPGIEVLPAWIKWLDANGDGRWDHAECVAYADLVQVSLQLQVDGTSPQWGLEQVTAPTMEELKQGTGTMRLVYKIHAPRGRWKRGIHRIQWSNNHFTASSVHLSNALIPSDRRLQIIQQQRDETQREYTLTFRR